jgi:hypothetical protein
MAAKHRRRRMALPPMTTSIIYLSLPHRSNGKPAQMALLGVRGGDFSWRHQHLPVRCNRPVLYIAGIRLCGGRLTEALARRLRNLWKHRTVPHRIRASFHPPNHTLKNQSPTARATGIVAARAYGIQLRRISSVTTVIVRICRDGPGLPCRIKHRAHPIQNVPPRQGQSR